MQFTTQTQQLTTFPQCDNVVHIDAEFCNICGKRLRPAVGTGGTRLPGTSTATQTLRPISSQVDEEEYEDDDDSEEVTQDETQASMPPVLPPPGAILTILRRLQDQPAQKAHYLPE